MTITPISSFNHHIHGAIPKQTSHCSEEVIIENLENNKTKPIENHLRCISNNEEKALAIKTICSKALERNYLEVVPNMVYFLLKNNMTEIIYEIIKISTKGTQVELELLNSITFSALENLDMNTIEHILFLPLKEDSKLLIVENQLYKIAETGFFQSIRNMVEFLLKQNKGIKFLCNLLDNLNKNEETEIKISVFKEIACHCISYDNLELFKYIEKSNLYDKISLFNFKNSLRNSISIMEYIVSRSIKPKEKESIPIIFNKACEEGLLNIVESILINSNLRKAITSENITDGLSSAVIRGNLEIVQAISSSDMIQNVDSNEKYVFSNLDIIKNILCDALSNQSSGQSIEIINCILDIIVKIPKSNASLTKTELDYYFPLILSLPEKSQRKIIELFSEILFSKFNKVKGKDRDEFLTSLIEKSTFIKSVMISNKELMENLKKCNSLALEFL